jgi:hypothetical protein
MTEADWLAGNDPVAMLEFLRGNPTGEDKVSWFNNRWQTNDIPAGNDRKFRLFACHCCRRIWNRIPEACNRDAVVAIEEWLEGDVSGEVVTNALRASSAVEWKEDGSRRIDPGYWAVKYLGRGLYKMTAGASAVLVASQVLFMVDDAYGFVAKSEFNGCYYSGNGVFLNPFRWPTPIPAAVMAERTVQSDLIQDIFGNPFRPILLNPAWLTSTVQALSRGIYKENAFDRLPILADALQDAGCESDEILDHCRQHEEHVRGCWVVDLLLDKDDFVIQVE